MGQKKPSIPESFAGMPIQSQFVFLTIAIWEKAQDPSSKVTQYLEELRRPLLALGYSPLSWVPQFDLAVPDKQSLLTDQEKEQFEAMHFFDTLFWNDYGDETQRAEEWIDRQLLGDPDRAHSIAWQTIIMNPQVNIVARSLFPPSVAYWPSPFLNQTAAEFWIALLAAFEIPSDEVGSAVAQAGSKLTAPVFFPQMLPSRQILEEYFRAMNNALDDPDISTEAIRESFWDAERMFRIATADVDNPSKTLYLRLSPSLSKKDAIDTINDFYGNKLSVLWKTPINPTKTGRIWWKERETILRRANIYLLNKYARRPLREVAIAVTGGQLDDREVHKDNTEFKDCLEMAHQYLLKDDRGVH